MEFHYLVVPAMFVLLGLSITWFSMCCVLSPRTKSLGSLRKIVEGVLLSLAAIVCLGLVASSGFNAIAFVAFRYAPPGSFYHVNGRRMRLECTGRGSPTIVLESGLGNDGLIWGGVQPILARTTRVCSYDRAGYGWSDAVPPPRDADHIAEQLHGLLAAAQVEGPIVLMGHSIGGIYIRDFASRFPTEVAGLIFVDGSTPLQEKDPAFEAHLPVRTPGLPVRLLTMAEFSAGIPRWLGACSHPPAWPDRRAAELMTEDRCYPGVSESLAEAGSWDRSGYETEYSGPYGALPILIFSEAPAALAAHYPADVVHAWSRMQQNLLRLSTRSRQIIAKGSGHYIQLDRPELIEREAARFIEGIRGPEPQPAECGTTTE